MRTKLEKPRQPNTIELKLIEIMEKYRNATELTLSILAYGKHINTRISRDLRYFKERYNNHKFIGVTPLGEIHKHKGAYRLIRKGDKLAAQYIIQDELDFLCAIEKRRNRKRNLGELQARGQLSYTDLINATDEQLQTYHDQLLKLSKEEEE